MAAPKTAIELLQEKKKVTDENYKRWQSNASTKYLLKDKNPNLILTMNNEAAYNASHSQLYRDRMDTELAGFIHGDSLIVNAHGNSKGQMGFSIDDKNYSITPELLGKILEKGDLIPDNIKSIYTMSCYGGLQQPFELDNGIKIQSAHTAKTPTMSGFKYYKSGKKARYTMLPMGSDYIQAFKQHMINNPDTPLELAFGYGDFLKALNKFNSKAFNFTEEQINKYNDNFINYNNQKTDKIEESISESDISNKRIKEINKDRNKYVKKHFNSPSSKKIKKNSKDSIFFKLDNSVLLPIEPKFDKNGISIFGNDTTAFILAHGADDGKIVLRRNGERLLVSSEELTGSLEDMLPDTIKNIYTINCYGGKQKEYYTNRGIHVQSIHQETIPIKSLQNFDRYNKNFGILTLQKELPKEVLNDIYKNVYKNKLLSETPNLKNILLPEQLEEVINGLYLKQWQNIKNKKPKTKKSNKKPKSKKQNKKSKPKKQINKNVDNIELPKQNQRKPKVLGERLKQQQIQKDVLSRKSIQEQQTLLDLKKSIDKPVNQNTERKLQKKELSHQELYDLNKNNNQGIKQKINNVNTTSKNTNTPKVKGEKLDIIGNRKDMAMMVDILKNNGQKTADKAAAQIAKNICSSGNRYGKGAISILSKII